MTYDWWLSALELVGDYGVLTREHGYALGIHEDAPQPGFYRVPPTRYQHFGDREACVAIWPEGDHLRASWDGEAIDPCAAWSWCCRYPISEDRFRRMERDLAHVLGAFASTDPRSGDVQRA